MRRIFLLKGVVQNEWKEEKARQWRIWVCPWSNLPLIGLERENEDEQDSAEDVGEDDDDNEEEEEDEEVEKPRKRARKAPPTQSRRRASAAKSNGVSKASNAKKPRKPRKSDAGEVKENPNECPMLGESSRRKVLIYRGIVRW